jgi:signal transduction histidine kinase
MKKILILFFCTYSINAQKHIESLVQGLKTLDTTLINTTISNLNGDSSNQWETLYGIQRDLLIRGYTTDTIEINNSNSEFTNTRIKEAFSLMTNADVLKHQTVGKDSTVHSLYRKALRLSLAEKNKPLTCELIKKLLLIIAQNSLLINEYPYYLKLYYENQYDDFESLNLNLLKINYEFSKTRNAFIDRYSENLNSIPKGKEFDILRARNYAMMGRSYDISLNDYENALKYHQMAIDLYLQNNLFYTRDESFSSFVNKAIILFLQKKNQTSISVLREASKIKLRKDKEFSRVLALDWMSKNYEKLQVYDSALFYNKERIKLQDSLNQLANAQNISFLQTKFKTAEKEKQILEEQQKVRVNRNWLIVAGFTLLFGAGIAFLLQNNTTKKRLLAEQEALLKQERVDNLLKEQELVSIDAMIAGQEKERQRVANELHDDLGSLMATIKLHFDNSKVSKKDPALKNAQKLLEEAYQKVRGMAHSKNSGVMSDQGLLPAVKKMAQVITETNALEVVVEDFGMGDRLENSLELNLFRMVQELVANAIKHAEASKVSIQLTQHEDNLNIIIEDNGKGFDRSKVDASKTGMGLTTIEKRVEHLEGNFTVDSILGKGTSILIDIPV